VARDLAGNVCERSVVLQPPAAGAAAGAVPPGGAPGVAPGVARGMGRPDTTRIGGRALADSAGWFELACLPANHVRVTFRGAPAGSRGVTIGGRAASLRDGDWSAVVSLARKAGGDDTPIRIPVTGRDGAGRPWTRWFDASLRMDPSARAPSARAPSARAEAIAWQVPRGAQFEATPVPFRWSTRPPGAPPELAQRSQVLELLPGYLRLRKPMQLEWGMSQAGSNVGLYGDDGEGWSWITSPLDSATARRVGETRHFGRFALFADTVAPRVTPLKPPAHPTGGPYSRWALEARIREQGSGVDPRASWVEVDGRRKPAEWDGENEILRWRPMRSPKAGPHRFTVVVRDRAGNERRASGRFVMK